MSGPLWLRLVEAEGRRRAEGRRSPRGGSVQSSAVPPCPIRPQASAPAACSSHGMSARSSAGSSPALFFQKRRWLGVTQLLLAGSGHSPEELQEPAPVLCLARRQDEQRPKPPACRCCRMGSGINCKWGEWDRKAPGTRCFPRARGGQAGVGLSKRLRVGAVHLSPCRFVCCKFHSPAVMLPGGYLKLE